MASAGYSVRTSETAEQALEMIKEDKPSIILLDLSMPGTNGLELTRRLRADEATKDIAIVAITGRPGHFPKQKALEAGCDAYVLKPVDTRTLPKQVGDLLSEKKKADNVH